MTTAVSQQASNRKCSFVWTLLSLAACVIACVVAFSLRDEYLFSSVSYPHDKVPDARFLGYDSSDIKILRDHWTHAQRKCYAWSQLTLDTLFPFVYSAAVWVVACRILRGLWLRAAIVMIWLVILSDLSENALLVVHFLDWRDLSDWIWLASFWTRTKWWLLLALAVVLFVQSLLRHAVFLDRLVRLRYGGIAFVTLAVWGLLACTMEPFRPVAANVLLLEDYRQLAVLMLVNVMAIVFTIAILRLQRHRIRSDSGEKSYTGSWPKWMYVVATLVASITPGAAFAYSYIESDSLPRADTLSQWCIIGKRQSDFLMIGVGIAWMIAGAGLAWGCLVIMGKIRCFLLGSEATDQNFFPFEATQSKARIPGVTSRYADDIELIIYLLSLLVVFFVFLKPRETQVLSYLPIPGCIVMLIWITTMILSGLSAWFDRTRIPVIALVVVWIVFVRALAGRDATLPTVQSNSAFLASQQIDFLRDAEDRLIKALADGGQKGIDNETAQVEAAQRSLEDAAWQAIVQRMKNYNSVHRRDPTQTDKKTTLVVVTCPGGGIHAAAWTAYVLDSLHERYSDFAGAVCVISGVSGGSVGAMFHVHSRYIAQGASESWKNAAESSLGAIGGGMVFDDLPGLFLPLPMESDRGKRLERAWKARLGAGADTMQAWGQKAQDGSLPILILNATDAASGRRVLFSTVPTPRRVNLVRTIARPWDFRELLGSPNDDMHVATAARASATFPYVSPFTRPESASPVGQHVAIGDGGYADNEGIVSAVDWVDFLVRRAGDEYSQDPNLVPFQRIVLLRIQPSGNTEPPLESRLRATPQYYLRWLTGPLEALVTMRTASQVERGQIESDLAARYVDSPWWESTGAVPLAREIASKSPLERIYNERIQLGAINAQQSFSYQKGVFKQSPSTTDDSQQQSDAALSEQSPPNPTAPPKASAPPDNASPVGSLQPPASGNASDPDLPTPQMMVGSTGYAPVVILSMPFLAESSSQRPPLNWKLSPSQKNWYSRAWADLLALQKQEPMAAAPNRVDAPKRQLVFFSELDEFFTQRAQ